MTPSDIDLLKSLQAWYTFQCDGEWEHTYGVKIATLDNPGWSLKIDLAETNLLDRPFDDIRVDGKDQDDWYMCRVRMNTFEAACGPNRLSEVVAAFLNWAQRPAD
jgi:hypothetical protein